jgi:VWFA-related protein
MVLSILPPAVMAAPQESAPTFRAGVALVKVDVQVTDRAGRSVTGLTADDFVVFDEGAPQKVVHFSRESDPVDLVLLLDVSGSMARSIEELASAARSALAPLGPADRVGVILFARTAEVREELTADRSAVADEIRRAVRDGSLGGGSEINASIIFASQYLGRQVARGRRAVLILTDNQGLQYQSPDEAAVRQLLGADTVLNAIIIGKQRRPGPARAGANPDFTPADVFKLAEQTGGEAVESRQAGRTLGEMIERIRSRYSLHYEAPAGAQGFRRIRVELSAAAQRRWPDARVRARSGYDGSDYRTR